MTNYPEPPELGWYAEDVEWAAKNGIALNVPAGASSVAVAVAEPEPAYGAAAAAEPAGSLQALVASVGSATESAIEPAAGQLAAATAEPESAEEDSADDDMDSTVLSVHNKPKPVLLRLRNRATGQEVTLIADSVLGRKLKKTSHPDLEKVRLTDSTRTVSREHAIIRFDDDGAAWVEDLDSLNGTSILRDDEETAVEPGTPGKLTIGDALRVGDEFYDVLEPEAE